MAISFFDASFGWSDSGGSDVSKYLGKLFYNNLMSTIDQNKVNRLQKKIENIKLTIIDAAESGTPPPKFEEMNWLEELRFQKEYKFVWDEFSNWLSMNGLAYNFISKHDYNFGKECYRQTLEITLSSWTDYDNIPDLDTNSWMKIMKDKWNEEKLLKKRECF